MELTDKVTNKEIIEFLDTKIEFYTRVINQSCNRKSDMYVECMRNNCICIELKKHICNLKPIDHFIPSKNEIRKKETSSEISTKNNENLNDTINTMMRMKNVEKSEKEKLDPFEVAKTLNITKEEYDRMQEE